MDDNSENVSAADADAIVEATADKLADEAPRESEVEVMRRDRLLAGLTLVATLGLVVGIPFALQAGASFFLPTTAAIVIAIAMVPLLERMERHRVPSSIAALLCVLFFLLVANIALASIVLPAWQWVRILPERIDTVQSNLAPLLDLYSNLEKFVNKTLQQMAEVPRRPVAQPTAPPRSIVELFATSAPSAFIEMFYAILVIYFFLSGWTRIRRNAITSRTSFGGALATARVIQDVVDDTSSYIGTITLINLTLGATVAGVFYLLGMPTPLMWGGIVALLNYIPYLGPILAAGLIALGGLMTYNDVGLALLPAALMVGAHLLEANAITPLVVGHRLTINPLLILISLSFWSWVWGTPGALLAVPLLIIIQTVMKAAGKPDIAGFLFEHGTLVNGEGEGTRLRVKRRETPVDT